jgi:hypothetical protein
MTTLPVDMTTHSEPRGRYLARWRTVPRELGFLLAGLPVALLAFVVTITMFSFAAGTLVVVGGFFVLAATMLVSRWFGRVELARLEAAGMPRIDRPDWDTPHRPGPVGWLRHYLANAHFWLYLLHAGVVNFVVSLFSWIVAVTWTVTGLGCLSYGIWGRFAERDDQNVWLGKIIIEFVLPSVDMGREHSALFATEVVLYLILGVVFIATLPCRLWANHAMRRSLQKTTRCAASSATSTTARSSVWFGCSSTWPALSGLSTAIRMLHGHCSKAPASSPATPWRSCASSLGASPHLCCKTAACVPPSNRWPHAAPCPRASESTWAQVIRWHRKSNGAPISSPLNCSPMSRSTLEQSRPLCRQPFSQMPQVSGCLH